MATVNTISQIQVEFCLLINGYSLWFNLILHIPSMEAQPQAAVINVQCDYTTA